MVWSRQYPAGTCRINGGSSVCYTTSHPAIDPNRQYVYSYGLDGKVHKYQVGDGTEITTGGWPELTTLKGLDEKGSSALSFATAASGATYLYMTNGGYPGDNGDYQGHVTAINLADGTQKVSVLWSDTTHVGGNHWESPIVVNATLYINRRICTPDRPRAAARRRHSDSHSDGHQDPDSDGEQHGDADQHTDRGTDIDADAGVSSRSGRVLRQRAFQGTRWSDSQGDRHHRKLGDGPSRALDNPLLSVHRRDSGRR